MTKHNILFNKIANDILNYKLLSINEKPHRICEVEFYLYSADHIDPFTHRDKDQSIPNNWYFHKKNGTYKCGTFKGLDMTFRPVVTTYDKKFGIYGGMLIRSISILDKYGKETGFIEGPCRVVDYILNECNMPKIKDFVDKYGVTIEDNEGLTLIDIPSDMISCNIETIYNSPRVGLTLKNPEDIELRKKFIMQNYRYVIYPWKYKKNRKLIACQMIEQGLSSSQVLNLMKMTPKQMYDLQSEYEHSKNYDMNDYKKKTLKVADIVSLMSACNNNYQMSNDTTKIIEDDCISDIIDELYA